MIAYSIVGKISLQYIADEKGRLMRFRQDSSKNPKIISFLYLKNSKFTYFF